MQSNKTKRPTNSRPKKTASLAKSKSKTEFVEKKVGYYQKDESSVTTLYIGNLKYSKDEFQVKTMLEKFGKVKYVKIVVDPKTNESKGIAFAQMPNGKHAKAAIEALNNTQHEGRTLKVSIAKQRAGSQNFTSSPKLASSRMPQVAEESAEVIRKRTSRRRPRGLKVLMDHLGK